MVMRKFTNSGEFILGCFYHGDRGFEWLGDPGKRFDTIYDALAAMGDDNLVEAARVGFDAKGNRVWEDVTEELAKAWIDVRRPDVSPDDADEAPVFVINSTAWTDFVDSYEEPADDGCNLADPASMRKAHGTHSHAMTGVRS